MRESVKALIDEIGLDYWMQVSKEFIEEGRRAQLARTRQLTVPGIYRGHTFYGHVTKGKPGYQPLGDPDWLYNIPIEMEITTDGKVKMDFEGTQPWGYHSMNCTPAGMLLRSFFEVEILGPYFTASFVVYYGLFKLRPAPATVRPQRARVAIQEAKPASG